MRIFGAICVPAFLFLACGSDDDHGQAANDFNAAYCDLTAGVCCKKSGQTYNSLNCQAVFLFNEGKFDKTAGDACLAGLRAAQNSPTYCADNGGPAVKASCDASYKSPPGNVPGGGNCKSDSECAAPEGAEAECVYASGDGQSVQRTCQVRLHGAVGADCAGDRVDGKSGPTTIAQGVGPQVTVCWEADNLYCSNDGKKCTAYAALGAPCTVNDANPCGKAAFCGQADATKPDRTCIALGQIGGDCQPSSFENDCISSAYCDFNTKKCAAITPLGSACDTNNPSCGSDASCDNGICTASGGGLLLFCGGG